MKKLIRIASLFLVLTASLFFLAGQSIDSLIFKYRQNVIRKEIKAKIKNGVDKSELFRFSANALFPENTEWIKPGKEFKKNGTLYDIVRIKFEKGKIIYDCISDEQETHLFAELDQLVKKRMNDSSNEDFLKNLAKDFIKICFSSADSYIEKNDEPDFHSSEFSILISENKTHSPPPRLFV